ncbi:MAG TPA: choice-of-anchor tandem repeat GloVer-containing protein, partial [Candidatus Sulfotelmatobacter sp.]|nr:choice-of-anchor tandem repeat GloVer-containing protein [Candidatus Sulfotelmatobacter sp.]
YLGGTSVVGMVFKINLDGTGFTNLHSFTPLSTVYPLYTNYDGGYPLGALTLSGQTLYGTTSRGGALGNGCVFAVNTDGTGFTNLHSFADREGRNPQAELVLSGSTLYGTTYEGGSSGSGTVFKLETNGGGFSVVHSFTAIPRYPAAPTNEDGANPASGLIISGNTLFGTTCSGGKGYGSVFAVNTDGTGFTNLHWFSATCTECQTNSGGAYPQGRLTLVGNTLYGTTPGSENFGPGTIFAVRTDGTGFTTLHKFSNGAPGPLNLVINDDGLYPRGGLLLSDYTLYGTTGQGGSMGYGTVFSLSLLPQLTITTSGAQVVLTWPTNLVGFAAEFTLQSSTNFVFPGAWTPVSPKPVVINGLNTVTELISDGPKFYRLSQ